MDILVLSVLPAIGCEPEGPGANGTITLGAGVTIAGATSLEIRAFSSTEPTFSPATLVPYGYSCGTSTSGEGIAASISLEKITFPYNYELGCGVGATQYRTWQLVAFLAKAPGATAINPGDWFGSHAFSLSACGAGNGEYCGVTVGVDVEVSTPAPAVEGTTGEPRALAR